MQLGDIDLGSCAIANPEDGPHNEDGNVPFLFWFTPGGGFGSNHPAVAVWARSDHWDTAFELAQDWAAEHCPGIFVTFTEADYREAAEDLGIEWPGVEALSGCIDDTASQILEHAEADHSMVGRTTYEWQEGTIGIPSDWWTANEEHDPAIRFALALRSDWLCDEIWPND